MEDYGDGNDGERWHGHGLHAASFATRDFLARRGLPENSRTNVPLPDQLYFEEAGAWQQHRYHTSLGSYTCLIVDDILCLIRTEEDHLQHMRQVCATLEQHHPVKETTSQNVWPRIND